MAYIYDSQLGITKRDITNWVAISNAYTQTIGATTWAITLDGNNLIVVTNNGTYYSTKISRYVGDGGDLDTSFEVPITYAYCDLYFYNSNLYACDFGTDKIYKYSGFTSTVSTSFSSPSTYVTSIVFDGSGNLWSSDVTAGKIYKHSGFGTTISDSFSSPSSAYAMTTDGSNLFVSYYLNKIIKYSGFSSTVSSSFSSSAGIYSSLAYKSGTEIDRYVSKVITTTESVSLGKVGADGSLLIDVYDRLADITDSKIGMVTLQQINLINLFTSVDISEFIELDFTVLGIYAYDIISIIENFGGLSIAETVYIEDKAYISLTVLNIVKNDNIAVSDIISWIGYDKWIFSVSDNITILDSSIYLNCGVYLDIGWRIWTGTETISVAVETLGSHRVRIHKGGTTYGVPLVDIESISAVPKTRVKDTVGIKSLVRY